MIINEFLKSKRTDLIDKWQKAIINTYPKNAGNFLQDNKNQFANPIGFTINQKIPVIFDELIGEMNYEILKISISDIIRIRAVQDFTFGDATGFILLLKSIIKTGIEEYFNDIEFLKSYFAFETKFDELMSISFESYLEMRTIMQEIKLNEVKRRNEKMIERLSRKYQIFENDENINN